MTLRIGRKTKGIEIGDIKCLKRYARYTSRFKRFVVQRRFRIVVAGSQNQITIDLIRCTQCNHILIIPLKCIVSVCI